MSIPHPTMGLLVATAMVLAAGCNQGSGSPYA